uniref:Ig-like domain-containing protein n=1 Tax=Salarias fasciatus TaxID=181472 RepID=A0A672H326_SALFA
MGASNYLRTNCKSHESQTGLCLCFSDVVVLPGVSVTGGDLTVVEGHDVTLPCKMTQEKRLTQISWKRKTRGMPGNPFFFTISEGNGQSFVDGPDPRISFIGHFAERNGTLQISNVSLNDEGSYTCIFSLFPSGIYSTEIPLGVEATSLNSTLLVLGNEEVLLATCTAAASRPAAQLRWITGALEKNLRETTSVTEHGNGTTTTVSSLFGVPRREISGHEVQCVVNSSALAEEHRESVFSVSASRTSLFKCVIESLCKGRTCFDPVNLFSLQTQCYLGHSQLLCCQRQKSPPGSSSTFVCSQQHFNVSTLLVTQTYLLLSSKNHFCLRNNILTKLLVQKGTNPFLG